MTPIRETIAAEFAELAGRLRSRGHHPELVAHFINRLVFCMFAEDVDLLPNRMFRRMLDHALSRPSKFAEIASDLFRAMNTGGRIGFESVEWFNGGLFNDDTALPLEKDEIALVIRAADLDWAEVDPSILGTLFERGLDPSSRTQLGAHYTDRDKIMLLLDPVIARPLRAEWADAKARIVAALERKVAAKGTAARNKAHAEASGIYKAFLDRVGAFRVLDPACGSGNFLYLSLLALKDIELQASVEADALGLDRALPMVGPESVRGIEINPYAAELARVSVWIGEIQWMHRNGFSEAKNPVLKPLDTIECRDAVLAPDGTPAPWPAADAIVGNPPFLGDKVMIGTLGEEKVARLRRAYAGRVPGGADLVCYWFERAREELAAGRVARVGLVGTNSIRGGANRRVLDRIAQDATIFDAWSDEPWTIEGAAVRVSLVSFAREPEAPFRLDGHVVARINTDLTASADLTAAHPLAENAGVSFIGTQKSGPFDIDPGTARAWLREPANANGRPNRDVVRPWRNGLHIMRRADDAWVIDFGTGMSEDEAAYYAEPFAHALTAVKPMRDEVRRDNHRRFWWRHGGARPGMRAAIAPLIRYIATPRVAKHRVFVWLPAVVVPDCQLVVIARDDAASLGILHSRFHELWSLRLGTALEDRPRYTPSTTFETFPFPDGLTPDRPAAGYAADPRAQAIAAAADALVASRDRWLNPDDLVIWEPEVVPGFPDRPLPRTPEAAAVLKKRTMTALYNTRGTPEGAWLDRLHRRLDEAVAAAYGWPADLPDDEVLARLLALNLARPAAPSRPSLSEPASPTDGSLSKRERSE